MRAPAALLILANVAACGEENASQQPAGGGDATIASAPDPAAPKPDPAASGAQVYRQHCLTCHQPYGGGVPGLQPPLAGSDVVTGDIDYLVEMLVRGVRSGPESLPGGDEWSSSMPSFDFLSDEEMAAVLTHVRKNWGNDASAVTAEQVDAARNAEPAR